MPTIYLCIGGNLGDRAANLEEARMFIGFNIGDITTASPVVESTAWGPESFRAQAPDFLNQVLRVETDLSPKALMREIAELEEYYGRERKAGDYLDREMDVDLLFYADQVLEEASLTVPHPRLHERRFVLVPLHAIAPDLVHPGLGKSVEQLLKECTDTGEVRTYAAV